MPQEQDIFERQIKEMLANAEVTPPSSVWRRIRRTLDAQQIQEVQPMPVSRRWTWAGISFAAVAVAALALVMLLPHNTSEINPESRTGALVAEVQGSEKAVTEATQAEEAVQAALVQIPDSPAADRQYIKDNTPSGRGGNRQLTAMVEEAPEVAGIAEKSEVQPDDSELQETGAVSGQEEVVLPKKSESLPKTAEQQQQYYEDPFAKMEMEDRMAQTKKDERGFSMSANGFLVGNVNTGNGRYRQSRASIQPGKSVAAGVYEDGESTYGIPLTVGLGVRYNITDRWSIGSGLDYSYLTRNFRGVYLQQESATGEEGIEGSVHHEMHYIGIPLSVNFNILNGNKFHLYVLGIGEAEWCLANSYTINADAGGTYNYKEKVYGTQFSAGLGFGAEIMLARHFSLFLDPSVRYYFPSQQPKNIRTDKKITVGADFGVRFQF